VDAFPQPRFAIVNGQYDRQRLIQHAMLQRRAGERACILRQLRSVVLTIDRRFLRPEVLRKRQSLRGQYEPCTTYIR